MFGGQARNLLRNQSEEGLFSKVERAIKGATNRREGPFYSRRPTAKTTKTTNTTTTTTTATTTTPKAAVGTPTGPRLAGHQNARGATPDLCSPFGLVAGPKRRAVL